ncbi:MAG: hypothetical protein COT24_01155 [Candidatus Kerfeldbacteria bacterium CG08_land_8_20_14_0_20_40_16]|uniref:Glycosyltransferase 2-like domain-containing protein n=1 Tax=Candidatus Kerfeldbacteria bacterium CG08_land_8_20_14_0_20_40_16 TaxID=2014244 RepID=A0A2H0YX53_9BACT|nr:MAG: hypothetical protein COT24_01155 [Candidatus Kerfeldbacteria bacterium CG08_land_8_20_14_0_20_40_16]
MNNKIYVIIVTWNGQQYIADCLNSLYSQKEAQNFRISVVDNNSKDKTEEIIRSNFKDVILIKNNTNLGFAKGNNIGIRKALELGTDLVVLLNQDTEVAPDFIKQGLKYLLENQKVGLASSIILYPQEKKIWFAGTVIYRGKEILKHPNAKIGDHINKKKIIKEADKNNRTDWLPACALFIKKEVFETIGFLDETFFMYGEDVDFSLRAQKAGFQLGYLTDTLVIHKENIDSSMKINKYQFKKLLLRTRARFKIVWRYFNHKEKCYYYLKLIYAPFVQLFYAFKKIIS